MVNSSTPIPVNSSVPIDINEGITEARLVTSQEFENMLRNSEITDSFSVACYLHARLRGLL